MITIERIDNFNYFFGKSDKTGKKYIARSLTWDNPNRYAYSDKIRKFNKENLTFKIGMLDIVLAYLKEVEVKYELYDYEYKVPAIPIDERLHGKYEHQADAVKAFFKRRFGIIEIPTRGGKTFFASEVFRLFSQTDEGQFLFVVDTIDLFLQAEKDFKSYFERYGGIEIGKIGDNEFDISKRITIATIQTIQATLSKRNKDKQKKKQLVNFLHGLKFLCVDEIHDNSSDTRLNVYRRCKNIEYQLCLSATPYKSQTFEHNLKLMEWSGGVIYSINEKMLIKQNVLTNYIVCMLYINHNNGNYNDLCEYNEICKKIIYKNNNRNSILLGLIAMLHILELKTLIIFSNIEHQLFMGATCGIPCINYKSSKEERQAEMEKFLSGKGGFLMTSGIFKKGVTLPEAQVVINFNGGLEKSNVIQKKGRVLGSTDGKTKSMVIDFFDQYDYYLSDHSESRLEVYLDAVGEEGLNILNTANPEFINTFKNIAIQWFQIENC